MIKEVEIVVDPETGFSKELLEKRVRAKLEIQDAPNVNIQIVRRSIDGRSKQVRINLLVRVFIDEKPVGTTWKKTYGNVKERPSVIIVGAGPAGIFAGLRLIELGFKPILLERGKDVRTRRRDLAAIIKNRIVDSNSNYCFGEGGAGTYSDGKLYTRSKKKGDIKRILEIMVAHGAKEEILIDAHPHIGTNKLPVLVTDLRNSILEAGGEVCFNRIVTDFIVEGGVMKGVRTSDGETFQGIAVILATGHSARDIFYLLHEKNILIEAKPFAMGVRIEHQQSLIDRIQYHSEVRSPFLPASSYSLVAQAAWKGEERGVFSFCMCPGGFIVPAATAQEEVVVNGMSPSRRDSTYANSGVVVAIEASDWQPFAASGVLAGLEMQKVIERKAWLAGGKDQTAPACNMLDFVERKAASALLPTSYQPGLKAADLDEVLGQGIAERLRKAFVLFGAKKKGYLTKEAQIIGVESRTSSPITIPRDRETLEHIQIQRLFPCGEGAGYAGGILSAAMDGERCAEALVQKYGSIG